MSFSVHIGTVCAVTFEPCLFLFWWWGWSEAPVDQQVTETEKHSHVSVAFWAKATEESVD